jgi:hypothetical protein
MAGGILGLSVPFVGPELLRKSRERVSLRPEVIDSKHLLIIVLVISYPIRIWVSPGCVGGENAVELFPQHVMRGPLPDPELHDQFLIVLGPEAQIFPYQLMG